MAINEDASKDFTVLFSFKKKGIIFSHCVLIKKRTAVS